MIRLPDDYWDRRGMFELGAWCLMTFAAGVLVWLAA